MSEIIQSLLIDDRKVNDPYQRRFFDSNYDYKLSGDSNKNILNLNLETNNKINQYDNTALEFPKLNKDQKSVQGNKVERNKKRKKTTLMDAPPLVYSLRSSSKMEGALVNSNSFNPVNITSDNVKPNQVSNFFKANKKLFMKTEESRKRIKSPKHLRNTGNLQPFNTQNINHSQPNPFESFSRIDTHRPVNTFITDGIASDIIPSLDLEKPPLLTMLEEHLYEQLEQAHDENDYISVFKECFSIMGQHFTTYSTYLEEVSRNYEQTFKLLKERVNVKKMKDLTIKNQVNIEDEVKINTHLYSLHVSQKEDTIRKENERLKNQLSESETKVLLYKRQYNDLEANFEEKRYKRNEIRDDAHYLHYSLRSEVENTMIPLKDEIMQAEQAYEDMKRMEERTKQNLKDAINLKESLVPEEEYLKELKRQKYILNESEDLYNKIKYLRVANRRLRGQIEGIRGRSIDREDVNEKLVVLQHAVTPRPEWSDYTNQWPQFAEEWKDLSSYEIVEWLSSYYHKLKEKVDMNNKLIDENKKKLEFLDSEIGEEEKNHEKYFYGLGNSDLVPAYMRYTGRIRKKNIPKRDCELILEEFWEERKKELKKSSDNGLPVSNFQDFFSDFIKNKYGMLRSVRAEWVYNLTWACERYIEDPDCELFLRILRGEISEDAYKEQFEMFDKVHEAIMKSDQKNKGILKKKRLMKVIKKFFKTKTPERLHQLRKNLDQFDKKKTIQYKKLFEETRDKTQSDFVEELRRQFLAEVIEYTEEIVASIKRQVPEDSKLISLKDIVNAFNQIDPMKPKKEIDKYIQSCLDPDPFGINKIRIIPVGQVLERGAIPDESFMVYKDSCIQRLRSGKLLKRTTPKSGKSNSEKLKKKKLTKNTSSLTPSIKMAESSGSDRDLLHTESQNSFNEILDDIEKRHHKSFSVLPLE